MSEGTVKKEAHKNSPIRLDQRWHSHNVGQEVIAEQACALSLAALQGSSKISIGKSQEFMLQMMERRGKKLGGRLEQPEDYSRDLGSFVRLQHSQIPFRDEKLQQNQQMNDRQTDISYFIEDMELVDIELSGRKYTWKKGDNHTTTSRQDRILFSEEWKTNFRNIRQKNLHRVTSDLSPIMLEYGEWAHRVIHKNLKAGGDHRGVQQESQKVVGVFQMLRKPDFVLVVKP